MQFFAGEVKFDAEGYRIVEDGVSPRYSFDNFISGFLLVFMVITGENYNEFMYAVMISTHPLFCFY